MHGDGGAWCACHPVNRSLRVVLPRTACHSLILTQEHPSTSGVDKRHECQVDKSAAIGYCVIPYLD